MKTKHLLLMRSGRQITWGKGKSAYFHLWALMSFAAPLSVSVEAWLTHTATHWAPCNICTHSDEHRAPWNLPSNPVTLRISVTYTAMTLRPLAAPSARNRITISKNCWMKETRFTFWTRKHHCDFNNPAERRSNDSNSRSTLLLHRSRAARAAEPYLPAATAPAPAQKQTYITHSEQPRQPRSRVVWKVGRVSYRHLLHDSHKDCPSTSVQQSGICQFVSVSLYLKPVLEWYGWIKETRSPPHKAHIRSYTYIYYCSDLVLHTGIIW